MGAHQFDLFPQLLRPRAKPRVLMHVCEAGDDSDYSENKPVCRMRCPRCKTISDWLTFDNVTEAKRGIPCVPCNMPKEPEKRRRRSATIQP